MNSFLNENCEIFSKRFPELFNLLKDDFSTIGSKNSFPLTIETAKNGSPTATEKQIAIHSKYNPEREALQLISNFSLEKHQVALFLSFGLGYAPIEFAKKFPEIPIIIIENNIEYFYQAFSTLDWTPVLNHNNIVFAINTPIEVIESLLGRYKSNSIYAISTPSQANHCKNYVDSIKSILSKNAQKENINTNTLEKFSHLWLSNSCKNIKSIYGLDGINKFSGINNQLESPLPFIVLAAGPSLQSILPHLKDLQKRSILVCVDTALHSCLSYGIQPDFIILVDPQYACAMHLEFLESPESILITESAAWPSVFRFKCKETVLCSSMFPIGQYFESQLGSKGKLGAGGSVATTAWDFARICGAKKIFMAGMDLGFPGKQTHIRGSQFEEREHRISTRTNPSETQNFHSLMSAYPSYELDYNGNKLLTDKRMSLFSWWFESNCLKAQSEGTKTYTLTKESLAIKNIFPADINEILDLPDLSENKALFFDIASQNSKKIKEQSEHIDFMQVYNSFLDNLEMLNGLAKKGLNLCDKAIKNKFKAQEVFNDLSEIDNKIINSQAKNAAALVFPTERKLKELTKNLPEDPQLKSLYYSKIVYSELISAIREYQKYL